ncbi:50S ribosomal protein L29 [Streptococcus iniae]
MLRKKTNSKKNFSTFVFKSRRGQLDQTARLNEVKKQIARVKTVQSEMK